MKFKERWKLQHSVIFTSGLLAALMLVPGPLLLATETTFGLCEDYPEQTRTEEDIRLDLKVLRDTGSSVVHVGFNWDEIEPERGEYHWDFWDRYVEVVARQGGIKIIPFVAYTPEWASTGGPYDFWKQPPHDNEDFRKFMAKISHRYRDAIDAWEIWTEPNNADYWLGSVQQYADLLKAGARGVRAGDPTARVVLGGLAWNIRFAWELFEKHDINSYVDVVNMHNYYETWFPAPIETIIDPIQDLQYAIETHGNGQEIWMAEVGYSSYRKGRRVSAAYSARYNYEHTVEFQAAQLVRVLASSLATQAISLIAWYELHDLPSDSDVIGDVNNRHLGITDEAGQPKPAYRAFRFFSNLFQHQDYQANDETGLAPKVAPHRGNQHHVFHHFKLADGTIIFVAWLQTAHEGTAPQDGVDTRQEQLTVEIPMNGLKYQVTAYNHMGAPVAAKISAVHRTESQFRIGTLDLRPAETVIIKLTPNSLLEQDGRRPG